MHVSKHKLCSLRIVDASVGQHGWEEAGTTVDSGFCRITCISYL